jgi:hypothetical protein
MTQRPARAASLEVFYKALKVVAAFIRIQCSRVLQSFLAGVSSEGKRPERALGGIVMRQKAELDHGWDHRFVMLSEAGGQTP